jgi:DNA-binding MarR family transcriptional regulator
MQLGYLLHHLPFVIDRQSDQVLQERLGLGFAQFKLLMCLQWNNGVQQRDIADRLGQTEASVSRQIKLMHERGWLDTKISPHNRRQHITIITPKGERLADEALRILNEFHGPMFENLGEKGQQQLLNMFVQMHQHTCQSGKIGACDRPFSVDVK